MILVNECGDIVRLGAELARAGEGIIYEVISDQSLVAKLYHAPLQLQKANKLRHLCRSGNEELLTIAALPRRLLFASGDHYTVLGFLMPRIHGKEIHQLYGPRDRQLEYPAAAWDFLIHTARNCAAAFETLHESGIMMADVNEKNLLVTSNGLVRLIDCDSYQVSNGSDHFLCDVGVPLWTPSELQLRVHQHGYHGLERTLNHDRFGLAVLVFELLFMGRHPFAGVPDGHHHFEIHEAIQQYLFAFSPHTWQRGIKAPPHTLPLRALPERLIRLSERAFLLGSERANARPTGREWARELDALHASLKTCNYDPGHKYWNGLANCPWCEIMAGGGPNFFISVAIHLGTTSAVADISSFWATIQKVLAGDLMQKNVAAVQLPVVMARVMPFPRPIEPRLSRPHHPLPPIARALLVVPAPIFPSVPVLPPPALISRLPADTDRRNTLENLCAVLLCSIACVAAIGLQMTVVALIAGAGGLVFLIIWAIKWDKAVEAAQEQQNRIEAERQAYEKERSIAEAEHPRRLAEYEAEVTRIKGEHARIVAQANGEHARECSRIDAECRANLSAYSAQLSLFNAAWAKVEGEKRQWDSECNSRAAAVEQSRREMNEVWERLRGAIVAYQAKVRGLATNLESAYQRFQKTSVDEATDMKTLEAKKREAQLRQFLDAKLIRNHSIDRIRPVDAATLLAFGVESALDITAAMRKVPGIGDVRRRSLLNWRAQCENTFRYNPNTPLPQVEVQAVKLKHAQPRQSAMVELRGGAGTLLTLETEARVVVNSLESTLPQLARAYAQALADHRECR